MTIDRAALENALRVCAERRFEIVSGMQRYDAAEFLADVQSASDAQFRKGAPLMRRILTETLADAQGSMQIVEQVGATRGKADYLAVAEACRAALG